MAQTATSLEYYQKEKIALDCLKAIKNTYPKAKLVPYGHTVASAVKTCQDEVVFSEEIKHETGYIFFVDCIPKANWAHDCFYLLVFDKPVNNNYYCVKNSMPIHSIFEEYIDTLPGLDLYDSNTQAVKNPPDDNKPMRVLDLDIPDEEMPLTLPIEVFSKKNNRPKSRYLELYTTDYKITLEKGGVKIYVLIATLSTQNRLVYMSEDNNNWMPIGEFYSRDTLIPVDKDPLTTGLISMLKEPTYQWETKGFTHKIERVSNSTPNKRIKP